MPKPKIYLDNSTTCRPRLESVQEVISHLTDDWGYPYAPHDQGQRAMTKMREAFQTIYHFLGISEKDNFVFTSSGTEAVNQAIFSTYLDISLPTGRNHFISSALDDASQLMSINRLQAFSCVGKLIEPKKGGVISPQDLIDVITPRSALVSLSWGSGLTGVLQPIHEISDVCKERGIRLHVDASHVLGKVYFKIEDLGCDILTFNGEELHAPPGTGGITFKEGFKMSPLILGGFEQGGFRGGPLNLPALMGLGRACKIAGEMRDFFSMEAARLRDKLETGILSNIPDALSLFKDKERLPHISCMAFPGVVSETLLFALNRKGIFACIGGGNFQKIALLVKASGIKEEVAECAISFSLSFETTDEEIETAIEVISEEVKRLKKSSLYLRKT